MEAGSRKSGTFRQRALEGLGSSSRLPSGLQMTPMIDVIFLLLTFFVITAKFRKPESFIPITLPSGDSVQSVRGRIVEPRIVEITDRADGCSARVGAEAEIVLSEETPEMGLAAMASALDRVCRAQGRTGEDPIELICHDEVSWDFVVKVYDVLTAMGAVNISFVMTEQNNESR
jgi:biopolymer transport protein ExbD